MHILSTIRAVINQDSCGPIGGCVERNFHFDPPRVPKQIIRW